MKERKRTRLWNYNYSQAGCYFVTICTNKNNLYFGEIKNQEMKLNVYGNIADKNWKLIPDHFDNVILDTYVIMPNHVHGIIAVIEDLPVGNAYMRSLQNKYRTKMVLSKVIQQYKSAVTREINKNYKDTFSWQKSFYDRIIRTEKEFYNIQGYIFENPARWEMDIEKPFSNKSSSYYYESIFKQLC